MTDDYVAGLIAGVILGTVLGLALALVILPGVVDVWYGIVRVFQHRRQRRWHGR